jgi:hypothetical protein
MVKLRRRGLTLALVRDLRDHRASVSEEDLADFETGVLAGFVLARASAGPADSTIRNDTGHLQLIGAGQGGCCGRCGRAGRMPASARCCVTRGRRHAPGRPR